MISIHLIKIWIIILLFSDLGRSELRSTEESLSEINDISIVSKLFSGPVQWQDSGEKKVIPQNSFPSGWFSTTSCVDAECSDFIKCTGLLTGQCLYSQLHQTSFFIDCENNLASIRLFNDSSCYDPMQYSQYNLSTTISSGDLFYQYTCTSNIFSLNVPVGKSSVIYE